MEIVSKHHFFCCLMEGDGRTSQTKGNISKHILQQRLHLKFFLPYPKPKKSGNSWHSLRARYRLPDPGGPHKINMGYGVSTLGRVLKKKKQKKNKTEYGNLNYSAYELSGLD